MAKQKLDVIAILLERNFIDSLFRLHDFARDVEVYFTCSTNKIGNVFEGRFRERMPTLIEIADMLANGNAEMREAAEAIRQLVRSLSAFLSAEFHQEAGEAERAVRKAMAESIFTIKDH